jgi:hypothetical protein
MVRTGRLTAKVDTCVAEVSRKALAHQLDELREKSTGWPRELHAADVLAREIAAFDLLVERRQALGEERRRLETNLDAIRKRIFQIRLDPSLAGDLRAEVVASREVFEAITAQLAAAFDDVKSYSEVVRGQLRGLRA